MEEATPRILATDDTHQKAKLTKTKLGLTWDEFVDLAAEELDPDNADDE